jgi:putative flippase GtrA
MSGFFLVRRNAIDPERLRPMGFKILLEIIGRSPRLRIAEAPFHFGERHAGRSKASAKEGMRYVRQLASLRLNDEAFRFIKFGLVGASGLVVNSLLLAFTAGALNLFYLFAAVCATQGSTAWNFALSERFVFPSGTLRSSRRRRCLLFFVMNNTALAVRGPIMFTLTSALGMHYLWSNLISMIALLLLRFSTADRWIWGTAPSPSEADSIYSVTAPTVPAVEGA